MRREWGRGAWTEGEGVRGMRGAWSREGREALLHEGCVRHYCMKGA